MSDFSLQRAGRGGLTAALTQPVHLPSWWRWPTSLVLALLTLPRGLAVPGPGVDTSWGAGLQLAQEQGLHFGRDIVFTYGPLGFLVFPGIYIVWQGIAAMVFAIVLQVLLCRTLLHVGRILPVAVAVAVTSVATLAPTSEQDVGMATILALSLTLLARNEPVPRWFPAAGGAAAAVLLLVTPTLGAQALAVAALVAAFGVVGRLRSLTELFASFFAVFAILWLATGNALGDVIPWLRETSQIVSGYSAGMALGDPAAHTEHLKALAIVVAISAIVVWSAARIPRARQAALALAWAVAGFGAFKEGFVRGGGGHAAIFFGICAVAAIAVARGRRATFVGAAVGVLATVWSFAALGMPVLVMLDYPSRGDTLVTELHLLASPAKRNALFAVGRTAILRPLRLPRSVVRDLSTHTVDVQPTETSLAWALGARWRPQPVFQSYAVLASGLDRLNADFLTSLRAPERVIRVYPDLGIDGRNPAFDAPAAFLALICNYREIFANHVAEVLARSTNRCGTPRPLGGTHIAPGTLVRVPHARADELVYARVQVPRPWTERARELLWKPAIPSIALDGDTFRLITATASGPLLMRMPRTAGIDARSLIDPHVRTLRLLHVPAPVRIDFYAVRITGQPAQR